MTAAEKIAKHITGYTRAELIAAIDTAHAAIHALECLDIPTTDAEVVQRACRVFALLGGAHDALHAAGAGMPRAPEPSDEERERLRIAEGERDAARAISRGAEERIAAANAETLRIAGEAQVMADRARLLAKAANAVFDLREDVPEGCSLRRAIDGLRVAEIVGCADIVAAMRMESRSLQVENETLRAAGGGIGSEQGRRSMKLTVVQVPSIATPIKTSPGFEKKELATHKLDIMALCNFGCSYCSSNEGNYLRINRERFATMTREQTGKNLLPATAPGLTFQWPDFEAKLDEQLRTKPRDGRWGAGKTLVFSQLTDAFSPTAVGSGLTGRTLKKVMDRTSFRVRVLTKSAIVGTDRWVEFFSLFPGRFVVGLSIGTLDDRWARNVEIGTSSPTARVKALHALQDAGVPTYGMLCPVFPDALDNQGVEKLVEAIRPERCETVWSEPYNDRNNWRHVAAGYEEGSRARAHIARMFGQDRIEGRREWSQYAGHLYDRVHAALATYGAEHKHRYLLYQDSLIDSEKERLRGAQGVLFQSIEATS